MKKVSTVAAKQTMNFPQPKLTISLDLGDRSSWYCLLDEVGDSSVRVKNRLGCWTVVGEAILRGSGTPL